MEDKRHFKRIAFTADIDVEYNGKNYTAELLDLSLKGILIKPEEKMPVQNNDLVLIKITLPMTDIILSFKSELVHRYNNNLGLKFICVDIDTITHLKRLMELNTGDAEKISEEMSAWLQE